MRRVEWERAKSTEPSYLAVLGCAQAIIFGGGIGEDTPFVGARVLEELEWCGLTLNPVRNEQKINREGRI